MSQFYTQQGYAQPGYAPMAAYTAPPQQESFLSRNMVLIGVVVVVVVLYLMYMESINSYLFGSSTTKPVDTPQGGVTNSNVPSAKPAAPGTPIEVSTPPIPPTPQVKTIEIYKDTRHGYMPIGENADWRTFQVGEVRVYTPNGLLSAADFESATYNTGNVGRHSSVHHATNAFDGNPNTFTHTDGDGVLHVLTLKLKNPQTVVKVEVLNRADCCQSRLAGAVLRLKDVKDNVIREKSLTSDMSQVLTL